jgi:hypothetical protein
MSFQRGEEDGANYTTAKAACTSLRIFARRGIFSMLSLSTKNNGIEPECKTVNYEIVHFFTFPRPLFAKC